MAGQGERQVSVSLTPTRSDLYWRTIYNKYDKNHDGKISYIELKEIIESREYEHDLPDNVVDKIMSLADRDNSGDLDYDEFVEMMHKPDFKPMFGHFVARYVQSIVPHQGPVDMTDGTYEEENSCWPPAIWMILISLVEIVMFCYDAAHGSTTAGGPLVKAMKPPKICDDVVVPAILLIIINLIVLLVVLSHLGLILALRIFISNIERPRLWFRAMLVFQVSAAVDTLRRSCINSLVVALGCVFGLIAALVAPNMMDWAGMEFAKIQRRVFLGLAAVDVGIALYGRYWGAGVTYIGYVAHGTGAIAGFLIGIGVLCSLDKRMWQKLLWLAAIFYGLLMVGSIVANGSPYIRLSFIIYLFYYVFP